MSIYIGEPVEVNDMQGPCPDGFHVPLSSEWVAIYDAGVSLGAWNSSGSNNFSTYLKIPKAGSRPYYNASPFAVGSDGYYWSSSNYNNNYNNAWILGFYSSSIYPRTDNAKGNGYPIRGLKNTPVTPTSSRTVLYQGTGSAGIYWNSIDGLISISADGTTWYTLMDKNLGATTVYNYGDTLTDANCGNVFQWGNNYAFPGTLSSASITTSGTQVNASTYGPGNYYSSNKFIIGNNDWDSSLSTNLRGGTSQGTSTKSVEVKNIYIGEKPTEYIEYKMNADSNGYLYVPIGGCGTSGSRDCPYSWKVSVDGGAETTYSGTGSSGGSITLSGYTASSSHTIKIIPTTEDYQRARAFCWYSTTGRTYLTEIIYDSSYMGYAVSATNTGDYFRGFQYVGCTNLTSPAEEYLPDTVTTIGNYFREWEYNNCTSLTYASEESLPSSVTSIGITFRGFQYQGCTALTEIRGWKDLSISIGSGSYRQQQFYNCNSNKTIKVLSNVGYNSYNQDTLQNSYVTSVSVPSAYLTNFKNSSNYPWVGITDSKFIGY